MSHESQPERKGYDSDVSDTHWKYLEPRLKQRLTYTNPSGRGRPMALELREMVNAILYGVRTGLQWANMPHDLPNYQSVYYHFRKGCVDGTWRYLNRALRRLERIVHNRASSPSAGILDSQRVPTTEAGGKRGFDAAKQVRGRKRHILIDTQGNLLDVVVHAANIQDYRGAKPVFEKVTEQVSSLKRVWADGIYVKEKLVDWVCDRFQIALDMVKRPPQQKGFVVLPRRWVVERSFTWFGRHRRLSKDYERCTQSSEGMVYAASIAPMLGRIAPYLIPIFQIPSQCNWVKQTTGNFYSSHVSKMSVQQTSF